MRVPNPMPAAKKITMQPISAKRFRFGVLFDPDI
jgi:hypothetical protein